MCLKRLLGQYGSVKKEYSENYKIQNTQRECYKEGYQNGQIKRDELIELIKQQIYQDEFIKWIKQQIERICCDGLKKSYSGISQEFDKYECRIENLEKEIETLKEAVKEKNGHSLLPNSAGQSIQGIPLDISDINASAVEPKPEEELRCEKPKDNCELFNEQINSKVTSPQFKNIILSFNGYNMVMDSEGGVSLYIVNKGNYDFELYPNQKIKDSRFREKLKYAFDFETQNANHTAKIVVKKPCILREYMSGYSIESKGLVYIL